MWLFWIMHSSCCAIGCKKCASRKKGIKLNTFPKNPVRRKLLASAVRHQFWEPTQHLSRRMNCRTHTHTYYVCNTIMLCAHVCTRDKNWFDCGTRGACFVSSLESSPIPPIVSGTSAYCNSTNDIFGAVTGTPTILS